MDPQNPDDVKEFKNILASKGSKIGLLEDINFPVTQTPIDPVLDEMIRFEYLTNIVKLQYLSDCTTGEFDYNSRYLGILKENARLLNSGGEPFKVYLNRHFRNKGYFGPLFSDRDPWEYESIADLNQVNGTVKNLISCSENWFALFCEYTLIKTSLHELTADIHDPENIDKYGYPDLMYLHDLEKEPGLSGEKLRNFVVSCLNLGIDPSENQGGVEQEVSHLAACKYAEVQSRRKEWIKQAWHSINRIKAKMSVQNISSVMLWQSYALCAYETGPVFIRKNRDFLLPRIARSFETYEKWDQARLRENMYEIIGKDVTFVIENYWDHFNGKLTVDFLKGNSDLSIEIKNAGEQLNSIYREINLHIDLNDSPGSGIPGIIFLRPKKDPIKDTRDTSETDSSKRIKSSGKNWTESGFLAELLENTGSEKNIETAKKLIEWAKGQRLQLGEKFKNQSFIPYIGIWPNTRQFFIIKTNGKFAFDFKHFNDYPFLESEEKRRELVNQLNTLKGVHFRESSIKDLKYPSY
ncbi:MAG: hypothetical protein Q7T80_15015, partial [Methanoregula sp.]|nr:hypothetical protein [Methanoregula sp.]